MSNGSGVQFCNQCGNELVRGARFCSECGSQVSYRTKVESLAKRLKHQTRKKIEEIKSNLDHQVSDYLRALDTNQPVAIGGITIPQSRRSGVKSAMKSFQDRFLDGDASQEALYEEWLDDLPKRLEEHNCIVCFSKWGNNDLGNIVVCPHCQSGGHRNHISDWIKSHKFCPLCREQVVFTDYIVLK